MLAARLHLPNQFGRSFRLIATLVYSITAQAAVAGEVEPVAFPQQAHGAVLRSSGKVDGAVRFAVTVVVGQDANVSGTRDDDAAARVDGHAIDVGSKAVIGELGD